METSISQAAQNQLVSDHYNKSESWNNNIYVDNTHYFNRMLIRRKEYTFKLLDKIMPDLSGRVIDLGCGPGAYLEEFKKKNLEIFGIDISQEMLNTCRSRLKIDEADFQKNFKCGTIEQMPFKSDSFDAAACIGVLELLLSDEKAISEVYRILKPGGIFLLAVENMLSLSNIDYVLRQRIKSFLIKNGYNNKLPETKSTFNGLTISSNYFPGQKGMNYKIYNPYKLVKFMIENGFYLADSLSVGQEFRVLRRLKLFPKIIDAVEISMENFLWKHKTPYFSNCCQYFLGAFIKI